MQSTHEYCPTVLEVLRNRSVSTPDKTVFKFLADGGTQSESMSFAELDLQARTIAGRLRRSGRAGDRVLLIYPSCLEFITAFFGCLYAEMIAVPVCPPHPARRERSCSRLSGVLKNAGARLVMCPRNLVEVSSDIMTRAQLDWEMEFLSNEDCLHEPIEISATAFPDHQTIALLQYTSGTTRIQKGVMVSHHNLAHNQGIIRRALETHESSIWLNWIPFYHDMGLAFTVLQPVFCGGCGIFMAPATFLQSPLRWLAAISNHRATHSSAPNFAYELCVRKVSEEEKERLDLRCWKRACNAAEPVRAETLDRFAKAFTACGFDPRSSTPGYGLAEATLIVSGGGAVRTPMTCAFGREFLLQNHAVEDPNGKLLAASGRPCTEMSVVIVNQDGVPVEEGRIGEIWVGGESVARGYWDEPAASEETFHARLHDGRGPFLRTGDLGFLWKGELYVTGRLKDVIIVRGQKHYPQDLEYTVERSHPALRPDAGAAFSVEAGDQERLVIIHELQPRWSDKVDYTEVFGNIQQAVGASHGLQVFATILLKPGGLPKTSSGKIQRGLCKEQFLSDMLPEVARYGGGALGARKPRPSCVTQPLRQQEQRPV